MAQVILSHAEVLHIAICFNERALRDIPGVTIAVQPMRLLFVRGALDQADPMMFELGGEQLRALDMLLTDKDPRGEKLPDGKPVMGLVETIWAAMIGGSDAGKDHSDNHTHTSADREAYG